MIKRVTAYSFVIIASIVLLVHAVIPHHCHNAEVCVEQLCCSENCEADEHSDADHDQKNDCGSNTTECVLTQVIVVLPIQNRILADCQSCETHNPNFYILTPFENVDLYPVTLVSAHILKLPPLFLAVATSNVGLRAPPVC